MNVRQVIPRDAIPSIDTPSFDRSYDGPTEDEVIVVDLDGEPARAYPIRILDYHEVVNDSIGEVPIAVTWCPLCASAVVYESTIDNRRLTFGVSGKLADDDLVLYDRETGSEWKQSAGTCIDGSLSDRHLEVLPSARTTVSGFLERHDDGKILQPIPGAESEAASDDDQPAPVDYSERPYAEYFSSDAVGLAGLRGETGDRSWERTDLEPKSILLGIEHGGDALGFPLPWVDEAGGILEGTVGGRQVIVVTTAEGIHAFDDPGFSLERQSAGDGDELVGDGTVWDPVTGTSADGRSLEAVPAKRLFAFAWIDDHGADTFVDRRE
ncbi:DUF3179 domain-containing protein [Natrialbaceae archaeon A-CW2]